jgi:OOP family OmpA-OmpF porin
MSLRPILPIALGGTLVALMGYVSAASYSEQFLSVAQPLASDAIANAGGSGIRAEFHNRMGSVTRHPLLIGGGDLDTQTRANVAKAVAEVKGVGGVFWADGTMMAESGEQPLSASHCEEDVEGLLRTRTIRFEGGSSALAQPSQLLLDEVAAALRPCLGSIIAITGHTDNSGPEPGNLALSLDRARAVRESLIGRGIPRSGLRAIGVGSREPVEGLAPSDPANRRIEFSVIETQPVIPTPVDTPGPR